ncbi:carboxypeptidase regulatory-like domain-containing protein [Deinococcus sp. 6YEL10]|uniref:Ig-like domain-containing protein n=1 Tax=Deinococcus sp. 6YEL10 TaxID=2745870 RepID=UPI001E4422EF|nr:Ig-like domain-containing protein [Deinococcus sp. 6YEL10]MCD0161800.1 carboxypeptidase regulatory-like domain-containing protein [Deinococcus sp. 6YEL10]
MALKPSSVGTALLLGTLLIGCGSTNTAPNDTTPSDTTAPTVTLTATPNPVTAEAANNLTLKADARDATGVTRVEFFEGTTKVGEDTSSPFEFTTSVNALNNGKRTYTATAYDAAGNKASGSTEVTVAITANTAPLRGTVVDQNIGAPVAGSTITVLREGKALGTVTTGADGTFTLSGLSAGTYDLRARKTGMAGSDLYGVVVGTETPSVSLVQRPAFETSATTNPATLVITRADGSPIAGATFTDNVDFRIKTAPTSDHVGPIRIMYAQLGRTPGSGGVTGSTTASNWNYSPPQDQTGVIDSDKVTTSGNFTAGFGSAAGERVYLEIMTVDYNYNYSRYVVPINLINTGAAAAPTVTAPTRVAATAFTLKQEGSWTTPYDAPTPDAAPNGSGVFVEVRWCYTNVAAKPFAFDIERSSDGTTFQKIGTVGGAASTSCSTNQAARPYNFRDTSSDLSVGKTFTYRVVARGANSVPGTVSKTTPLAQFTPTFQGPADESTGVSLTPTFVLGHNQAAIGADGAAFNLRLRDLMTLGGYNLPGTASNALIRVEEGTGSGGNGVTPGQSVVFTSTGPVLGAPTTAASILADTGGRYLPTNPGRASVDTAAHTVSLPLNSFVTTPLQPLRPYKWEMYSGFAYRYAPDEGNRISAYSVFTWPSSLEAPINQTRAVNLNWDFITGEK